MVRFVKSVTIPNHVTWSHDKLENVSHHKTNGFFSVQKKVQAIPTYKFTADVTVHRFTAARKLQ